MSCCVTVREIVDQVYGLLADPQRKHWTVEQLVDYINEALCEILTYRPDAFTTTTTLTLQPGRLQRLPSEYRQVVSLDFNAGGEQTPIREISEEKFRSILGSRCKRRNDACYEVRTWGRNPADMRSFYVNPPVPDGTTHDVVATVVQQPPKHSPDRLDECVGIDCAYREQVR